MKQYEHQGKTRVWKVAMTEKRNTITNNSRTAKWVVKFEPNDGTKTPTHTLEFPKYKHATVEEAIAHAARFLSWRL